MKILLIAVVAVLMGFTLAALTGWPSHAGSMFFFNVGQGGGGGGGGGGGCAGVIDLSQGCTLGVIP